MEQCTTLLVFWQREKPRRYSLVSHARKSAKRGLRERVRKPALCDRGGGVMRCFKILCILALSIMLTGCKVRIKIIEKSGDIKENSLIKNVQEVENE